MLAALTLATMLAQTPTETPPPPPPLPEAQVHSDTSSLPLDILSSLPAPASFDYDGDSQPETVTFGTTQSGQVTLTAKSSKTGKEQVLYTSKQSWTKLGVTNLGLQATGDPKRQVTLEVWGVKGDAKLSPMTLGLTPGAITLSADGKSYDFSWSGTGFKTKTK